MAHWNPTDPEVLAALERRSFMFNLRTQGITLREIELQTKAYFGEENLPQGFDSRYVSKDLQRYAASMRKSDKEEVLLDVAVQNARLEELLSEWFDRARAEGEALDKVLKIMDRQSKLRGFDAPKRTKFVDDEDRVIPIRSILAVAPPDDGGDDDPDDY